MQLNPTLSSHFSVQWGGSKIEFTEVQNLAFGFRVLNFTVGSSPKDYKNKIPVEKYFDNVILKRVVSFGDNEFFEWMNTTHFSITKKRDIIISLLNENHEPKIVWKLKNAFPVRLAYSDLVANENNFLIESLEIAYEDLTVEHK